MADDWKPGDLALCVNDGPFVCNHGVLFLGRESKRTNLRAGKIYPVDRIASGPLCRCLHLLERTDTHGSPAVRFIKVTPPEADEFDRETIALLTGKPAHLPA